MDARTNPPIRHRGPGRPFRRGQSGNPSGRPKRLELARALAQTHTVEAIETLFAIMRDTAQPAAARVRAAEAVLDRGWGKPTQPLAGEDGGPIRTENLRELSDDELLRLAMRGV